MKNIIVDKLDKLCKLDKLSFAMLTQKLAVSAGSVSVPRFFVQTNTELSLLKFC